MCLYPKSIKNRKYTKNKKNGGQVPPIEDSRTEYIQAGCGNCMECRKEKAREWQVRLLEDVKTNKNGKFITLTFSDESIKKLIETKIKIYNKLFEEIVEIKIDQLEGYEKDNAIAKQGVRRFLENWRKENKKSVRHWLVTELGHNGTKNIHIHGIIWTDKKLSEIRKHWKYGYIWPRDDKEKTWVNEQTVNYIVKYISKMDKEHKGYKGKVLTSAGIGRNYLKSENIKLNEYKGRETSEAYITRTGHKMKMPKYWRDKIYSEDEKERMWLWKLDKDERYVGGEKVSIKNGTDDYIKAIEYYRKINKMLGYGDDKTWLKAKEEAIERERLTQKRISRADEQKKQ